MKKKLLSILATATVSCLVVLSGNAQTVAPIAHATNKAIVFLGDSVSAGLGVQREEAFPALIGKKTRALGLPFEIINAGESGDTTADGLRRIEWLLRQKIDILVIELGANDGLRGLPAATMKANLEAIIAKAKAANPSVKIVIAGMQMPPNLGADYANAFQQTFPQAAQETKSALIPFLLEGVGGHRDLNQPDQIHPTARGHAVVAETVWKTLEPLLREP
jgi:acyl-CoA thioesterase-1